MKTILRMLLAATLGTAACAPGMDLGELEQESRSGHEARIRKGVLTVTGTSASTRLALRLKAGMPTMLDVDVDDDFSADFSFDRSKFDQILIDARAGDDVVRMDEGFGAFTH